MIRSSEPPDYPPLERDLRPQELQTPTAGCMLVKAARHLSRAAYDLRRTYAGINVNFSSERSITTGLRQLEGALERWREKYGNDLIMTDATHDYASAGVVGEDYISKIFGITKEEAVGAIGAMTIFPSMKYRVLLINQPIPMETFVIVDCLPQIPQADPVFNMRFRVPMHKHEKNMNGTRKDLVAELANV